MRKILILIFLLTAITSFANDVGTARVLFAKAVDDESACKQLIQLASHGVADVVMNGYRGAAIMVMAKHVFNPITKLKYFNAGKKVLDQAISLSPQNLELRFIRYSIQKNAPFFLGYRGHLHEDENLLRHRVRTLEDAQLQSLILSVLR